MSIATEGLTAANLRSIRMAERDVREIAKQNGIKVRKHPRSGIDVKFTDGEKQHFYGWKHLQRYLIKVLNLAE
jgi:hypothetical protein